MIDRSGGILRDAILSNDDDGFERLAALGPDAVARFHDFLLRAQPLSLPSTKQVIEAITSVSCRLARRFPDDYVELFNDKSWIDHADVVVGLGWTGRSEVVPVLIEALASDAPSTTRAKAAEALATVPAGPESVDALLSALNDPDFLVREQAVRALGQVGNQRALARLVEVAKNPPDGLLSQTAPRAARNLAARLGVEVDVPDRDLDSPREYLAT
jgi:HEAT repeat protein